MGKQLHRESRSQLVDLGRNRILKRASDAGLAAEVKEGLSTRLIGGVALNNQTMNFNNYSKTLRLILGKSGRRIETPLLADPWIQREMHQRPAT